LTHEKSDVPRDPDFDCAVYEDGGRSDMSFPSPKSLLNGETEIPNDLCS
jgi:hypothetical protein